MAKIYHIASRVKQNFLPGRAGDAGAPGFVGQNGVLFSVSILYGPVEGFAETGRARGGRSYAEQQAW
jgi:hypothetical protein